MPLNGTTAGTAVWNAINALTQEQKENTELVWQTVMTQIYSDITANAQVPLGIAVQVTPATGTGATTAPGTIV